MKILSGRRADNLQEAIVIAFRDAGRNETSPDIASIFASVIDVDKFHTEAEKDINRSVHNRYGRGTTWQGRQWFIALPQPRYDALPIPRITFAVQGHLVAPVTAT